MRVCVRALVLLQVRYDLCGEETSLCSQTRFVWRLVSGVDTLGRLGKKEADWRCFFLGLVVVDDDEGAQKHFTAVSRPGLINL